MYKDVKKGFGLTVKKWRGKSGISQEELAWRAGLHRSYVADIERGARNASLQSIEKLAKALEISLSTLFEPLGGPTNHPALVGDPNEKDSSIDILLVEDDPRDVGLTLAAFKAARLTNRVFLVRDGAEALDFAFGRGAYAARASTHRPLVMLLDLNLPKVHGLEVLRTLKAHKRTRHIRVVVLTMSQDDAHIRSATRLGAEAYIPKPVDLHGILEISPQLDFSWTLFQRTARASYRSSPARAGTASQ